MTRTVPSIALAMALVISGCDVGGGSGDSRAAPTGTPTAAASERSPLTANDPSPGSSASVTIPDPEQRPVMQMQVVLDRLGFTPGVVDGKAGLSTRNAIAGYQEANGMTVTGEADEATEMALQQWSNIPATRVVTIPADFAAGPFYAIPDKAEDKAKMQGLGYVSLDEKLAERFHTTVATLKALNPNGRPAGAPADAASASPGASASSSATASASPSASPSVVASGAPQPGPASYFRAGQDIRVPNVGADAMAAGSVKDAGWAKTLDMLGVGSDQPKAARVVVSKSKSTLKAFDDAGKLIAVYTATMGSRYDPLPLGKWKVMGVGLNPPFHYNPDLFWDAKSTDKKALLPPGPNGPVGVVWIDLDKPHYGIHGTPSPETIGRAESHGCVRLTNWDAARLAQMVKAGTQVIFEA